MVYVGFVLNEKLAQLPMSMEVHRQGLVFTKRGAIALSEQESNAPRHRVGAQCDEDAPSALVDVAA
jgi:hypothetical protein